MTRRIGSLSLTLLPALPAALIKMTARACLTYNTDFRYNDGGVVVNARESDLDSSP